MKFKPLLVNKATGEGASLALHHKIGNVLANKTNPLAKALGKKILRTVPPLQAAKGVNAPPPSIAKTGNTNTPGVFLTTARKQRDINDINTTPRNIMDWKDIK